MKMPSIQPHIPSFSMPDIKGPAEMARSVLVNEINRFESRLSPEEEIGGRFVSSSSEGAMHIEDIGWRGQFVAFYGRTAEGRAVEVIQHFTQISVTLVAIKATSDEPRRIGFALAKSG